MFWCILGKIETRRDRTKKNKDRKKDKDEDEDMARTNIGSDYPARRQIKPPKPEHPPAELICFGFNKAGIGSRTGGPAGFVCYSLALVGRS